MGSLTDQHVFSGIDNAHSDEIRLRAKLSPFKQPATMNDAEAETLYEACHWVCSRASVTGTVRDRSAYALTRRSR